LITVTVSATVIPAKAGIQARNVWALLWRFPTSPSFQRKLEPILITVIPAKAGIQARNVRALLW